MIATIIRYTHNKIYNSYNEKYVTNQFFVQNNTPNFTNYLANIDSIKSAVFSASHKSASAVLITAVNRFKNVRFAIIIYYI